MPFILASLGACDSLDRLGSERMRHVATEQLCYWRGNPVSGRQMARELARRDEACIGPSGAALDIAPQGPVAPDPGVTPGAAPSPQAVAAAPASAQDGDTGLALGTAEAPPSEPRPRSATPPTGTAPLVTPACAERLVRRGGEDGTQSPARAVAFRNRCRFPIRVLYAAGASLRLTSLTGLLRPGESSAFAPIEDGFDQPGFVVCGYAEAAVSQACRLGPGTG